MVNPMVSIEPFSLLIAVLPLAAYLVLLGGLQIFRVPMVTTGGRDVFALATAISGLVAIGPGELFFPSAASVVLGIWIWPILGIFYLLSVSLIVLGLRPRLVIYGRSAQSLTLPLMEAARHLDPAAKLDEAAGQVSLPSLGVHLRLDGHRGGETAEIFAFEQNLPPSFWNQLLHALRGELASQGQTASFRAGWMLAAGLALIALLGYQALQAPTEVVQGFQQWLWR